VRGSDAKERAVDLVSAVFGVTFTVGAVEDVISAVIQELWNELVPWPATYIPVGKLTTKVADVGGKVRAP
jgi:hypothetical protein